MLRLSPKNSEHRTICVAADFCRVFAARFSDIVQTPSALHLALFVGAPRRERTDECRVAFSPLRSVRTAFRAWNDTCLNSVWISRVPEFLEPTKTARFWLSVNCCEYIRAPSCTQVRAEEPREHLAYGATIDQFYPWTCWKSVSLSIGLFLCKQPIILLL